MIAFVSGGARSGKSGIAEQQVVGAAGSSPCYYLATAEYTTKRWLSEWSATSKLGTVSGKPFVGSR